MANRIGPKEEAGTYPENDPAPSSPVVPQQAIIATPRPPRPPTPRSYQYQSMARDTRSNLWDNAERILSRASRIDDYIRELFRRRRDTAGVSVESEPIRGVAGSSIRSPINRNSTVNGDSEPELDLIPFYIKDTTNNKILQFQCTVNGITENTQAEWNSHKYLGRPYSFHTYSGVARDLSFSFEVYPIRSDDLTNIWSKINYFKGLCFPAQYAEQDNYKFMTPPYVELTIGDLYIAQPGFFTSIAMTIADDSPWETGAIFRRNRTNTDFDLTESSALEKLPHVASFQCSFTILERRLHNTGSDLRRFTPNTYGGDPDAEQRARDEENNGTNGGNGNPFDPAPTNSND